MIMALTNPGLNLQFDLQIWPIILLQISTYASSWSGQVISIPGIELCLLTESVGSSTCLFALLPYALPIEENLWEGAIKP
mmetsp:Transcript_6979/g.20930  ORF Transcript_6979/g.20930 Transcript_6979/m.20930 type:complete len:80 (-) Transcript_6979:1109-1348(-)